MAQTMASMPGLRGTSRLNLINVPRPSNAVRVAVARPGLAVVVRAQQVGADDPETSRRAILGLVAVGLASLSSAQPVLAGAVPIKVGPPPPPSGGLPGTLNSDQPRDLDLPLKNRFYIQPLPPAEAAARAKESAKDIVGVKTLIEKKAWPYVQNDLRLKAEYLRYDLNTVISAKSREEKKVLKELTGKLFDTISQLDRAAKTKSTPEAEKYYAKTISTLDDVLAKLG